MGRVPFFIWSFDANADVLRPMLSVLAKQARADRLALYLGLNTEAAAPRDILPATVLEAPRSNWAGESLVQLKAMKAQSGATHVVGCLDDFIFTAPINHDRLEELYAFCQAQDVDYLRLKPQDRTVWRDLIALLTPAGQAVQSVPAWSYYPHSLQLAIWKIDYLISLIEAVEDPWAFELMQPSADRALYCLAAPEFFYDHCVEKGKWDTTAATLLGGQLADWDPGNRGHQAYALGDLRKPLQRLKFKIFGYAAPRLKRVLRQRGSAA